jgi:pSer/pThr/pTyr-binding forkhead associated (FHA) protein
MSNSTVNSDRPSGKFAKSFGGSLKSLAGGGSRRYFVLEALGTTEKHRAGETNEYIGDYVEIGRGPGYAVSFGDDCKTVSRPHAAILRTADGWALKHLSKNNPTLLNGHVVRGEEPLHNGDEIRLSFEGPGLRFLLPKDNLVGSMGMTKKIKAVMNEVVRPYKRAIATVVVLFLVVVGSLAWYIRKQDQTSKEDISRLQNQSRQNQDTIAAMRKIIDDVVKLHGGENQGGGGTGGSNGEDAAAPSALRDLYPGVFFLQTAKIVIELEGKTYEAQFKISGTGFLLNDGRFVTARHMVQPWFFINSESEELEKKLNLIASNGGKITQYMVAYSPTNQKIELKSDDFTVEGEDDEIKQISDNQGGQLNMRIASANGNDWAVTRVEGVSNGGLYFDKDLSRSLEASRRLYVLGFPFAMGANAIGDIKPIYSECAVSRDGLDKGRIDISGRAFDHGNSGGPVFTMVDGKYYVIGIVSAEYGEQGFIVPISAIP